MIVYVDGKLYHGARGLVAVCFSDRDLEHIRNMAPGCRIYCEYDADLWQDETEVASILHEFMKDCEKE